jgi:hypothetical protein
MRLIYSLIIIVLAYSCNGYQAKYPYSLKDFRPELRNHLEKIVTNGGVCIPFDGTGDEDPLRLTRDYLSSKTSEAELKKMLECEHPVLRAWAFSFLCSQKSDFINKKLISILDDTAVISDCAGEFGTIHTTVADACLESSRGSTTLPKEKVIKAILTKHPYLFNAAYLLIHRLDSLSKNYHIAKNIYLNDYPFHSTYRNMLLCKLSDFKKVEDTGIIKEGLNAYWSNEEMDNCFQLIENNPSPAFYFAIEKYYRQLLGGYYRNLQQEVTSQDDYFSFKFNAFIKAAAAYKSERSSEILTDIFKKNLYRGMPDFQYNLFEALKKYNSSFYMKLQTQIESVAKQYEIKNIVPQTTYPIEAISTESKDTW